jgi:hypothetical protein
MPFASTPPAPVQDAGPQTKALRPAHGLPDDVVADIRMERRAGTPPADIATALGLPVEKVELALAAMRTARPDRTRRSLNVGIEAAAWVHAQRRPDEAVWQTVDRLIDELIRRRRAGGTAAP